MSIVRGAILLIGLAACTVGDGAPAPGVDAAAQGSNGGSNGATADGGAGSAALACTGSAYDPCTDNSQCSSANCKTFGGAALEVCTVTCTPGDNTTCPGTGATCNNMGICKPAAANSCTR